ncbi:hypothetical protein J6590_033491 [Homalodisca vitripennis]|nr:hypothetical protein J6590_033491 [Homalodisca vitripennis]
MSFFVASQTADKEGERSVRSRSFDLVSLIKKNFYPTIWSGSPRTPKDMCSLCVLLLSSADRSKPLSDLTRHSTVSKPTGRASCYRPVNKSHYLSLLQLRSKFQPSLFATNNYDPTSDYGLLSVSLPYRTQHRSKPLSDLTRHSTVSKPTGRASCYRPVNKSHYLSLLQLRSKFQPSLFATNNYDPTSDYGLLSVSRPYRTQHRSKPLSDLTRHSTVSKPTGRASCYRPVNKSHYLSLLQLRSKFQPSLFATNNYDPTSDYGLLSVSLPYRTQHRSKPLSDLTRHSTVSKPTGRASCYRPVNKSHYFSLLQLRSKFQPSLFATNNYDPTSDYGLLSVSRPYRTQRPAPVVCRPQ